MTEIIHPKRTITRVDRSPMNAQRWCLTLECGHERWTTGKTKPKGKTAQCLECIGTVLTGRLIVNGSDLGPAELHPDGSIEAGPHVSARSKRR